jgi:hypothetical protein
VTDVQNWVSGANSNYGWLITESSSYFIAASSEGTNGTRPELIVTYTTPGAGSDKGTPLTNLTFQSMRR